MLGLGEVRCGFMSQGRYASREGQPGSPRNVLANGALVKLQLAQQAGNGYHIATQSSYRCKRTDLTENDHRNVKGLWHRKARFNIGTLNISGLGHKAEETIEIMEK